MTDMNESNRWLYVKLMADESNEPCEKVYRVLSFCDRYDNRPRNSLMMRIKEANELVGFSLTKENSESWTVKLEEFVNKHFL